MGQRYIFTLTDKIGRSIVSQKAEDFDGITDHDEIIGRLKDSVISKAWTMFALKTYRDMDGVQQFVLLGDDDKSLYATDYATVSALDLNGTMRELVSAYLKHLDQDNSLMYRVSAEKKRQKNE